jgi:hypothetical protein
MDYIRKEITPAASAKAREFLTLAHQPGVLASCDWKYQSPESDHSGAWRELRALAAGKRDDMVGELVLIRADVEGWRDWQEV